eukprot:jgi/Mesvir1/29543/Mv21128-RA.1
MALLGIAIFLLVRVRSSVSDSIASLWCTFTLRPGEQECKEKTSANVEDMFGGTVGVVAAGAVAGCHARAERAPTRGGEYGGGERAREGPAGQPEEVEVAQAAARVRGPVHGTGDNGGIESEGAVPAKPARIKTAANKGGGGDVKGSPPSPNGSSGGSASTPTSRGDNLDAHKWGDVDVELEEKPGGVAGMDAEEAEIYERVKARVRDHLEAAKRFISLNINSSDPDMRRLAEGTRDSLEHWFTKGRELKSAYLKTPEDDHMKELQAKYPDNWFEILRARSLDFYKTPFSQAPGVYEIIKGENERLGLPVRPPKFYGIDSDSTEAIDHEDLKKRLPELRYFPESNKDPPSYKEEKVHPDVARLEDSVEEAKRVAVLYKEVPKVTVREPTFKEKFRESVKDLTHDQREAMLKSLLVRMLADAIKRNEETRENNGHATPGREEMSRRDLLKKVLAWKTREKIPEHLQRWLTAATTTTAPKTPAVDTSIADSGVRAAPNTPAADATMNYRGVKQVTQDQRDQAFADVMAKTLGLSDTVKKAQEKAKELEGMLAESEKERKEGEERLGRAQQSLDKKGEELTKVQERIAALEADHSAQTEATRKEITELQSKEIDLKAAIERLEKRHADITKELQKVTAAKEAAERGLREANDRIRELSSELSGARDSLAEEQRRSAETAGRLQEQLAAKDGAIRAQEEVVQRGLDRVRQLEKTAELRGAEEARLRAKLDERKGQLEKATTAANESQQKLLDAEKELEKAIKDGKKHEEQFKKQEADRLVKELDKARAAADADRVKHAEELKSARSELAAAEESVRTLTAEQRRLAGQLQDALAGQKRAEEEAAAEKTRSAATEKRLQSELDVKEKELRRELERVRELENTAGMHDAEEARLRTALGDKNRQLDEAKKAKEATDKKLTDAETELDELKDQIDEARAAGKTAWDAHKRVLAEKEREVAAKRAESALLKKQAEAAQDAAEKLAAELDSVTSAYEAELKKAKDRVSGAEKSVAALKAAQTELNGQLKAAQAGQKKAEGETAAEKARSADMEKQLKSELQAQEAVLQRELKRVKELEKTSALHDAKEAELQEALREKNAQLDKATEEKQASEVKLREAEEELQKATAKGVEQAEQFETEAKAIKSKMEEIKQASAKELEETKEASAKELDELMDQLFAVENAARQARDTNKRLLAEKERDVDAVKKQLDIVKQQAKDAQDAAEELAAELERVHDAYEAELEKNAKELEGAKGNLRAAEQAVAALKNEQKALNDELKSAQAGQKRAEEESAGLTSQLRTKETELDSAHKARDAKEKELANAQANLNEQRRLNTEAEAKLKKQETELEQQKEESTKTAEELKAQNTKAEELKGQIKAGKEREQTLEGEVRRKEGEAKRTEEKLKTAQTKLDTARGELANVQAGLRKKEAEVAAKDTQLADSKAEVSSLNTKIAEAAVKEKENEKAVKDKQKEVDDANKEKERLVKEADDLRNKAKGAADKADGLQRDIQAKEIVNKGLQEKVDAGEKAIKKQRDELAELGNKLTDANRAAETAFEKAAQTAAELAVAVNKMQDANKAVEKRKESLRKLGDMLQKANKSNKGLKKNIAQLEKQIQTDGDTIESLNEDLKTKSEEAETAQESARQKQKNVEYLEATLAVGRKVVDEVRVELEKARGELKTSQAAAAKLTTELKAAQTVIAGHDAAIARKDAEINARDVRINQLNALLVLAQQTIDGERAQAAASLAVLNSQLDAKNAEIANAVIIVTQLKGELDKAQGEVERLDEVARARAGEVDSLRQANQILGDQLSAAQLQLRDSQARVKQLEQEGVRAADEITRLKGVESAQNTRISILQDQVSSGAQALRDKEGQLQTQMANNKQLHLDLDAAKKTVGEKENEIANLTTTLRAWMEGYAALQAKEAATQGLLDQATQDKDRLDREVKSKEASLVQAQQDKNVLEGRVSTLVQEHAVKEQQLNDKYQKVVDAARAELDKKPPRGGGRPQGGGGCVQDHAHPRPFVQYADSVSGVVRELGPGGYWICDFTPGVHCLLALVRIRGGRTVCSLIHWDKGVYVVRMPPFKTKLFKGTVLQGVLARDGLKTSFVVHDCLAFARKSQLSRPFEARMEMARDVVGMNFPSHSSYLSNVFLRCVAFMPSNSDQSFLKSQNVLFIPNSSTVSDQYKHGNVPIALVSRPELFTDFESLCPLMFPYVPYSFGGVITSASTPQRTSSEGLRFSGPGLTPTPLSDCFAPPPRPAREEQHSVRGLGDRRGVRRVPRAPVVETPL